MGEQSHKEAMREAIRGDLERARSRNPSIFERPAAPPEPEVELEPEPVPPPLAVVLEPEPVPEPVGVVPARARDQWSVERVHGAGSAAVEIHER